MTYIQSYTLLYSIYVYTNGWTVLSVYNNAINHSFSQHIYTFIEKQQIAACSHPFQSHSGQINQSKSRNI